MLSGKYGYFTDRGDDQLSMRLLDSEIATRLPKNQFAREYLQVLA